MFKVEDKFIIWDDSYYLIPPECTSKIVKIYGTATAGLSRQIGIFLRVRNGESVEVATEQGTIAARLVGPTPERGTIIFIREQLDPVSGTPFWLASSQKIENDMNWINAEFEDNSKLVLCPFTMDYGIK
jgi:hypothetical protein